MEAVGIGYEDGIRCYDAATGKVRWRMPAPADGTPVGTASADLNTDGRDEALFVIGQTLYCVGAPPSGERGALLWKIDFPVSVGPPAVADADGDGLAEIVVVGSDGFVYGVG